MTRCKAISYIGLGSNLENPQQQLKRAFLALKEAESIDIHSVSKLYQSVPLGPSDQPNYYNAVVRIETQLLPEQLLDTLQAIENKQGRVRMERWGARTLDLDILLYGQQVIDTPRLTIPHSQMHLRNFVLFPIFDIDPELVLPSGKNIALLCEQVSANGLMLASETFFKDI